MNSTIKRGAVFFAPLIIAGSLFGTSAEAAQRQVIALQVDSICTDIPSARAVYAFQNKNAFSIDVNWFNTATGSRGVFTVPANSFNGDVDPINNPGLVPGYATDYAVSDPNNRTEFTAEGWTSTVSQNARVGVACTPNQLPPSGSTPSNPTNGGGTTSSTPVSTGGGDQAGGKGGDTTAADDTASPELADTGAQQIIPFGAAALIAIAMLGTTIAVRKNLL